MKNSSEIREKIYNIAGDLEILDKTLNFYKMNSATMSKQAFEDAMDECRETVKSIIKKVMGALWLIKKK